MTTGSTTSTTTFAATSGTQTITSAGLTLDFPVTLGIALATTAASGNGTTATLTFAAQTAPPFAVGSTINVVSIVPIEYRGTYTVTACTTTTVSYANATTGAQTTAGGVGTTNTVQLIDALTLGSTRTLVHASGTFDLTDKTVTTGRFSQGTVAVRTMAFGTTGSVNVTGNNASIWITNGSTPSTLTGTPTVNFTYSGSTGTRTTATGSSHSTTNRYNFNFTAGSDTVNIQNQIGNLDFTGFSGTWANFTLSIIGNLTLSSTMTVGGGTAVVTFFNWGGTHQVTSVGKSLDFPITIGAGLQITDASGDGTTATLTFVSNVGPPPVGSTIQVAGLVPAGYNTSSAVVTASSNTSVSYANATTGARVSGGAVGSTSTVRLEDAMSQTFGTNTRAVLLSFGGFDLNDKTCTLNLFSSTNTAYRTLAFTTTQINILGGQGTVWNTASGANLVITGTDPTVNLTNSGSIGFRNIGSNIPGQPNNGAISFNVTAGTDIVSFASNFYCKNANFTGFSGTLSNTGNTGNTAIFWSGNLTISSGMSITAGTSTWTWIGSTGGTITSAGKNFNSPLNFAMSGGATVQLLDDLSVGTATARAITLTSGRLDLNDKTLTNFGSFNSSGTLTRSIAFGTTGNYTNTFNLGGTFTIFNMATATNFSLTGTPTVNVTGNSTAGTRTLNYGNVAAPAFVEQNSFNINITAGSDSIALSGVGYFRNLDFTGSFTGTLLANTRFIYGNYTLNSNMTVASTTNITNFAATSGTQLITTAGRTLDIPITISSTGATVQLVDALIMGSTRALTLTNGTFNSNAKNVTCGTFSFVATSTKTLTITNSTITILGGTSTTGFIGTSAGTTYNITDASVIFTTSGVTAFGAGGAVGTFPTVTMSGTGQLIIGQTNASQTINTLSNTVQPCTITINATAVRLFVNNFNLSGTAGNLVTLNSSVAGTQASIRKTSGTVNAEYLYIQDSIADGGAVWNALNSTDAGNNTGWNFLTANNGNFFMMF